MASARRRGAESSLLRNMVMRQAMLVAAIGIVIGVAASSSWPDASDEEHAVWRDATDRVVFATVAGLLAAVALLASYLGPARALRVDPVVALRYE